MTHWLTTPKQVLFPCVSQEQTTRVSANTHAGFLEDTLGIPGDTSTDLWGSHCKGEVGKGLEHPNGGGAVLRARPTLAFQKIVWVMVMGDPGAETASPVCSHKWNTARAEHAVHCHRSCKSTFQEGTGVGQSPLYQ